MAYFPVKHWDSEADKWDETVANKNFPHYFYYYEADLYIGDLLKGSDLALELGAGTCGSTLNHGSKDRTIVAVDYSRSMLEVGRRKLRSAGLSDYIDVVVADVCHLPFRNSSFDTVFSRGVAICYAADPEEFVKEARRVLHAGGHLGLDFMNKSGQSKRRITRFDEISGKTYYVEMFNENGKQKRIGYQLPSDVVATSLQTPETLFLRGLGSTPAGIRLDELPKEEWWAVFYTPGEAKRLVRKAGFRQIKTYPLGCFTRGVKNPSVRKFLTENRDEISTVQKEMASIFRLDKAVHVFLTAELG